MEMNKTISRLEKILKEIPQQLLNISDNQFHAKPAPNKWSKKEIIGHLIDSAFNNYYRFIRAQHEDVPQVVYDQDEWNRLGAYQTLESEQVIQLWRQLNLQILHVLKNMVQENFSKTCNTGRETEELHSIEYLACDYVDHLEYHLHQVIESYEIGKENAYLPK